VRPFTLAAALAGTLTLALVAAPADRAEDQTPPPPPTLDGRGHPFQDALIERLAGEWRMTGQVRGRAAESTASGAWTLAHQWLRLEMKDVAQPPAYEAHVYIGYDNKSERYVAHWLDVFGGRFSETLGYGVREKDAVRFVFEYPDGPFHTTFTAQPDGTWSLLMRTKNDAGSWVTFAEYTLRRR